MTFILPSFGASAISAVPASGGGGGGWSGNGYSVDFDGTNDYVDAGNVTQINSATNLSVSLWFKLDNLTSGGARPVLMAGGPGTFYIWPDTDTTLSYVTGGVSHSFTVSTWNTGQWYHLTTVHAGTSLEVYLDGSSIGTATVSAVASNQGNNLNLARWTNGLGSVGNYLDGKMDEVALFTSALSSSEVTAIYNSGEPADLASYSPVGWWRMGENDSGSGTTITDQGSGGNDGTLTNGPTFSTDVPVPFTNTYSVDLDGTNDYMDIGGSYDLGTFSAWFKPDSTLSSSVGPYMIAGFTGVGSYATYGGITVSGNITGTLTDEIITIYTGDWLYGYASSSATISNTAWHHVAVRWTGSDYEIYLDGSQVKNTEGQFGSLSKAKIAISDLSIGRRNDGGKYFPGLVDEVAIWSTPLSASDITAIYNSGAPTDLSSYSPNGWWRMGDNDSGTGTTITDQGSGGTNGTLTNGPTFATDTP